MLVDKLWGNKSTPEAVVLQGCCIGASTEVELLFLNTWGRVGNKLEVKAELL